MQNIWFTAEACTGLIFSSLPGGYMSLSPLGPPWRFRVGSTELADFSHGDSLWTAVYGKVKFFWIRASLVKYGRFEKKLFFEKFAGKNYIVV